MLVGCSPASTSQKDTPPISGVSVLEHKAHDTNTEAMGLVRIIETDRGRCLFDLVVDGCTPNTAYEANVCSVTYP